MPVKPFVARFGAVDFNKMQQVATPADADRFVCRQGALGNNVFTTRAEIRNPPIGEQILAQDGTAALPGFAFVNNPNMGFFRSAVNVIGITISGSERFFFDSSGLNGANAAAFLLLNEAASSINPTVCPNRVDADTGIGSPGQDQMSFIAGALDCINIAEIGAARQIGFYVTAPISLQIGVAVSAAGVHAALVNLGLITA